MSVIHFLISSEETRECLTTKMPATPRIYTYHYTVKVDKMMPNLQVTYGE